MMMIESRSISCAYNVLLQIFRNAGGYRKAFVNGHGEVHHFVKVAFLHFHLVLFKIPHGVF